MPARCRALRYRARFVPAVLCLLVNLFALVSLASAQTADAGDDYPKIALRATFARIQTLRKSRAALDGPDIELSPEITKQRNELDTKIAAQELRFRSLASGIGNKSLGVPTDEDIDLKSELTTLMAPLVQQLKAATEEPRQIERLRSRIAKLEELAKHAADAIERIQAISAGVDDDELRAQLKRESEYWQNEHKKLLDERRIASIDLNNRIKARRSLVDSFREFMDSFFRTRGIHLLVAIAAFFAVFGTLRFARRRLLSLIFRRRKSFYARLVGVILQLLVVAMSILAVVLVLFAVSDWILLVILLFFLFGVGWASLNMAPQFLEQMRVLLNLGAIREGERVVFDGIPWRIDELRVYTRLRNPQLAGGEYRLPIQELKGMKSRPIAEDEVWFPCHAGDWVMLGDGKYGRVDQQTPESVRLVELGGARVSYPTAQFLELSPRNLSTGYRISAVFGIDYAHQSIATTSVPEIMHDRLEAALHQGFGHEHFSNINVEFMSAAASSLDYQVQLDMRGSAAAKRQQLERAVARILVDVCNEQDWTIPFTQFTVHSA